MGYTQFEVWLMELGILTIHGRPRHPQTQGKEERFNRSFTRECLNGKQFRDLAHAQQCFDEYRKFYNGKRPHCALELEVPKSRYRPVIAGCRNRSLWFSGNSRLAGST